MLKVDLHIHTIMSGDAHNTIFEYATRANELKMKIIGISDHGPGLPMSNGFQLLTIKRIPRMIGRVMILKGVEANIINRKGEIDIPDYVIEQKLDYVLANFHKATSYKDGGKNINTETMIRAIRSGRINIISHPFYKKDFNINLEKVCQEACKYNVLMEIDIHYLMEKNIERTTVNDIRSMISIVRKNNKKLIVNSDSHNIWELADDEPLKKISKEIGIKKSDIINNYPKELLALLRID